MNNIPDKKIIVVVGGSGFCGRSMVRLLSKNDYKILTGGNVNGVIAAANRVLAVASSTTKIIPGHGELSSPEDLRAYRDMLTAVRDRVQTLVNDGKSIEDVIAAKPTAEFDAEWEHETERFVRLVYHSLKP